MLKGAVQIELAFIAQLEKAYGEEGFTDGADMEQLVHVERRVPREVVQPIGADALHARRVGQREGQAVGVHVGEILFDEAVEQRERGFVRAWSSGLRGAHAKRAERGTGGDQAAHIQQIPSVHLTLTGYGRTS